MAERPATARRPKSLPEATGLNPPLVLRHANNDARPRASTTRDGRHRQTQKKRNWARARGLAEVAERHPTLGRTKSLPEATGLNTPLVLRHATMMRALEH